MYTITICLALNSRGGSARDSLKSQWQGGGRSEQVRAETRAEYQARGDDEASGRSSRIVEHVLVRDPKELAYKRHYEDAKRFLEKNKNWIQSTRHLALAECRVELEFFTKGMDLSDQGRQTLFDRYTDEYFLENYGGWIDEVHRAMLPKLLHDASDRLAESAVDEEYRHASRSAVLTSGE